MIVSVGSSVKDDSNNIYYLDEIINHGGFGAVYKAHKESDGQIVAVKTLLSDFADPNSILSFQKELQQSIIVDSPYVIKYYYANDGTTQPDYPPFIIMEYANGGSLYDVIEEHRNEGKQFTNDEILTLWTQLAYGMRDVNNSLTHRDIKPQNILVQDGKLKITDFGLSKLVNDSTKTRTFKGSGTIPYMSPEAWKYDKNTMLMDVYSMGIVFFEIATLKYPYELPQNPTESDYRQAHLLKTAKNPIKQNNNLTPEMAAIIIKMLAKAESDRFQSWEEIIKKLQDRPVVNEEMNLMVKKALEKKNSSYLAKQESINQRNRELQQRREYLELIESQFNNKVIEPIKEFAEEINTRSTDNEEVLVYRKGRDIREKFSYEVRIGEKIVGFDAEILLKENFTKKVQNFMGQYQILNYIPQLEKKDILLWCCVSNNERRGFNIICAKDSIQSDYGKFFILENWNSGLSNLNRTSPFGFEIKELPTEIECIHAVHIYSTKILEFSIKYVIDYIISNI